MQSMKSHLVLFFILLLAGLKAAIAGPVGTYDVNGANPGDGSAYQGLVTVEKNGGTYSVIWEVDGEQYIGTGIGAAAANDGSITFGNAVENDTGNRGLLHIGRFLRPGIVR